MSDEKTAANVRLKESYQPASDVLERAYQPKMEITEIPPPPPVGSTAVIPSTTTESGGSTAPANKQTESK
jgi:hypothetical protein